LTASDARSRETRLIDWSRSTESVNLKLIVNFLHTIVLALTVSKSPHMTKQVYMDQRYIGTSISSEFFNTAGRTVKTGLTAAVIVSQWTWAATLLQSSNVAFQYGVSGPFWYASGATIQVLLFGILAIQVKRYAPTAHTVRGCTSPWYQGNFPASTVALARASAAS